MKASDTAVLSHNFLSNTANTYKTANTVITAATATTNKDHQRMMVDPMLMIVLDLRSFLTAVTTTAVAPTAVIL